MGGVGVHTPDLPNSIAWLSPKEELTFGDIDHTTQLRWFTLGRQHSASHACFHLMVLIVAAYTELHGMFVYSIQTFSYISW